MNLTDYQKRCNTTKKYEDSIKNIPTIQKDYTLIMSYSALGLVGEAGEIADEVKKFIRDDCGILEQNRIDKLALELGDCLWYIANMATALGFALDEIAEKNLSKLKKRYNVKA